MELIYFASHSTVLKFVVPVLVLTSEDRGMWFSRAISFLIQSRKKCLMEVKRNVHPYWKPPSTAPFCSTWKNLNLAELGVSKNLAPTIHPPRSSPTTSTGTAHLPSPSPTTILPHSHYAAPSLTCHLNQHHLWSKHSVPWTVPCGLVNIAVFHHHCSFWYGLVVLN